RSAFSGTSTSIRLLTASTRGRSFTYVYRRPRWYIDEVSPYGQVMPVPHHHWHALDKLSHLLHRKERERRRPETRFKPPTKARNVFEDAEIEIELEEDELE